MSTYAATIGLDEIEKIEIYVNKNKYTEANIATILSKTGGDLIFNGTIFSWNSFNPVMPCKANGKVLFSPNPAYSIWGIAWDTPNNYRETVVPCSSLNYISCVPLIINGVKKDKPNYQPDMGGSRPRTAIGIKNGKFAYFVTSSGYTPEKLRDFLFSSGWSCATMLDGGGSSSFCDTEGHKLICDSDRVIQHYIIVYLKKKSTTTANPYNIPTINLSKGSTGDGVKWLQYQLNLKGYNCGAVDGIFGNGTYYAVISFQKAKGLEADGIVGANTRKALLE